MNGAKILDMKKEMAKFIELFKKEHPEEAKVLGMVVEKPVIKEVRDEDMKRLPETKVCPACGKEAKLYGPIKGTNTFFEYYCNSCDKSSVETTMQWLKEGVKNEDAR